MYQPKLHILTVQSKYRFLLVTIGIRIVEYTCLDSVLLKSRDFEMRSVVPVLATVYFC